MSESKQEWKLPKNVRQIGDGSGEKKIYVEDYVVTYLNRLAESDGSKKAILLGEIKEQHQCTYVFANGALEVDSFYMEEAAREALLEKMKTYFSGKRVVGWFMASEESPFTMKKEIIEIFGREFSGENQILLVRDAEEDETVIFMMEDEIPEEQPGYYIYYDKNAAMQAYLISNNAGKSVDEEVKVKDDAIKNFRKIIKNKKIHLEKPNLKQWKLARLAGGFLVMTVLALGVTMVYNYDRMKEVEQSLARLTDNVESQIEYVTDDFGDTAPVMLHIEEEPTVESEPEDSVESGAEMTVDVQEAVSEAAQDQVQEQDQAQAQEEDSESVQSAGVQEAQDETAAAQEESSGETASSAPRASYMVKVGDTLADISEMYYGSLDMVSEICSLNGITDENTILPGQKILLP